MAVQRFGWWFVWGVASAALLLTVLKGAGLSSLYVMLIVLGTGLISGSVAVIWFNK